MSFFIAAVTYTVVAPQRDAHMAAKAQKTQMNIAEHRAAADAAADAAAAERAFNAANQKKPGMGGGNKAPAMAGTMLTGSQGVTDKLLLGKTSLLGG